MPRREAAAARSANPFDLLLVVGWNPFGRGTAETAVQQTGLAVVLPAAEGRLADPSSSHPPWHSETTVWKEQEWRQAGAT